MKIDFTTMQETILAQFKGGEKELKANMLLLSHLVGNLLMLMMITK